MDNGDATPEYYPGFDGAVAAQYAGGHNGTVLGKGERPMAGSTST
jgi:hypothetical protein